MRSGLQLADCAAPWALHAARLGTGTSTRQGTRLDRVDGPSMGRYRALSVAADWQPAQRARICASEITMVDGRLVDVPMHSPAHSVSAGKNKEREDGRGR